MVAEQTRNIEIEEQRPSDQNIFWRAPLNLKQTLVRLQTYEYIISQVGSYIDRQLGSQIDSCLVKQIGTQLDRQVDKNIGGEIVG